MAQCKSFGRVPRRASLSALVLIQHTNRPSSQQINPSCIYFPLQTCHIRSSQCPMSCAASEPTQLILWNGDEMTGKQACTPLKSGAPENCLAMSMTGMRAAQKFLPKRLVQRNEAHSWAAAGAHFRLDSQIRYFVCLIRIAGWHRKN